MNSINKNPRAAGVILHPTSLPSRFGVGDMGGEARRFVDFLAESQVTVWQILPLTPTGGDGCPYNSCSAFAGNEILIDPVPLMEQGLLDEDLQVPEFSDIRVDYDAVIKFKSDILAAASERFFAGEYDKSAFDGFVEKNSCWLDDYALFMAIRAENGGESWVNWPERLERHDGRVLSSYEKSHSGEIRRYKFAQWIFSCQWSGLKEYANSRHIDIMGDIPIFLSLDSADVWANQELFLMEDGRLSDVAGVPPDYFSADGQLWGNPLYNWRHLKKSGFGWWIDRFRRNSELYDIIRLDHFRGFSAFWAVPAGETTAKNGVWKKCPGDELFLKLKAKLGKLRIVAEDLGNIDESVIELRERHGFPGMKILQFAFAEGTDHPFLPHNFTDTNCVIYTGTHDNDTTVGWYWSSDPNTKAFVNNYLDTDGQNIHKAFIRLALSSIAKLAVFPLQDVLGWGSDCRLNTPGTTGNSNWTWRFRAGDIRKEHSDWLRGEIVAFNRMPLADTGDNE